MLIRHYAAAALLTLGLVGCGAPSEAQIQAAMQATTTAQQAEACGPAKLTAYADTMTKQLASYEQQRQLVATAPRISLGAPLQRLLDLQNETVKLAAPECLKPFHQRATQSLTLYQTAYQQFAAQADETKVTTLISEGDKALTQVRTDLGIIQSGKVPNEPKMATLYTDGLKVGRDAVTTPFKNRLSCNERTVAGAPVLTCKEPNTLTTLELIGLATNLRRVDYLASVGSWEKPKIDAATTDARTMLALAAPDWDEGAAWLAQALTTLGTTPGTQVTTTGGRFVQLQRLGVGSDQMIILTVEVP